MAGVGYTVRGDLALTADGTDFVIVSGRAAALQEIRNGATVFRGAWTYNRENGLPYFESILVNNPSLPLIRAVFTDWLSQRTGVIEVLRVGVEFNRARREAGVSFSVRLKTGEVLSDRLPYVLVPA